MNYTPTEQRLLDELATMEVVDAHEHLPREATRLQEPADALIFYRQYTRLVMFSAGLEESAFLRLHDPGVPWEERFGIFEQYRDLIRCSGADRAARIALERFYGEKELTRTNFEQVTAQVREFYRPGLYRKVLAEACGIRTVLQNSDDPGWEEPLFRVVPMLGIGGEWHSYPDLARQVLEGEHGFTDLDEYLQDRRDRLVALQQRGAVAVKHTAHLYCDPDRRQAERVFAQLQQGQDRWTRTSVPSPLCNYLTDQLLGVAGELGLPVAVHTGVWGDFRELDAREMIPHIQRHPEVRFDLFHMNLPAPRALGRIGANFGNVWLNMCWAHTVSPTTAANALDEWLDQVAANRIIAFGGDVRWPVEKVYGHLTLAREVVAIALARRRDRGLLDLDCALWLGRRFFFDNPCELYGLRLAEEV